MSHWSPKTGSSNTSLHLHTKEDQLEYGFGKGFGTRRIFGGCSLCPVNPEDKEEEF